MKSYEIERKYLVKQVPEILASYPFHEIEQGYLCTEPVVRIRRDGEDYYLTYKSKGLMVREEYNLPLTRDAYEHLTPTAAGRIITKERFLLPLDDTLTIELDRFEGDLAPLRLAEVEFQDEEDADLFVPPEWFGQNVSGDKRYSNSFLSTQTGLEAFL